MPPDPHIEAAILRQAFLGDIQTGHQLQTQYQGRRDPNLVQHAFMQHTIDALANTQHLLIRLDMDIRGMDLDRIFEHRSQQLDHGRFVLVTGSLGHAQIKTCGLILFLQLFGETLDFLGPAVELIEILQ